MAGIRTVARRLVFTAGIAAVIAVVPALAVVGDTSGVEGTVAQPAECGSGEAAGQSVQCSPDVPGVTAPVVKAPPPGAPNLETGGGQEQQQHSGSHH